MYEYHVSKSFSHQLVLLIFILAAVDCVLQSLRISHINQHIGLQPIFRPSIHLFVISIVAAIAAVRALVAAIKTRCSTAPELNEIKTEKEWFFR